MVASLAFLPTELLTRICDFVEPVDFVNFSLLNRRFQAIAAPFRAYHHKRWKKYAVLQDKPNTGYWFWHNVLKSVLEGWEGRKYVRTLKASSPSGKPGQDPLLLPPTLIHDWDYQEHKEIFRQNENSPGQIVHILTHGSDSPDEPEVPEEHRLLIVTAAKNTPWLKDQDMNQLGSDIYKRSFILALLISHLPDLRKLVVARYSSSELSHLQKAVSYAGSITGCRSVSHLTEVDFTTEEVEDLEYYSYLPSPPGCFESSFLLPFLSLPSIKSLKAARVVEGHISSQATEMPSSKLEYLTLRSLDVPAGELSSILARCTNLKGCELTTKNASNHSDLVAAIHALTTYAGETLQKLIVYSGVQTSTLDQPVFLGELNALEYLDITYDFLCLLSSSATGKASLSAILPRSLKTLRLHVPQFREDLVPNILALITDLPPQRAMLKCLCVRSWILDEDKAAIRQACQERGIRCEGDLATEGVRRSESRTVGTRPTQPVRLSEPANPAAHPRLSLYTSLPRSAD